jgi:cytidylate kinase
MIRTVTIGGEYGSGRAEIARRLAEKLRWRLLDKALIQQIASRAHVDPALAARYDECIDSFLHRMHKALWRGGYEGVASATESDVFDADTMVEISRCVIESAAKEGNCVIVGRGGQCILQERADAFHVFVYAPLAERIERVRREEGAAADPEAQIELVEHRRSAYIRRYFGQEWTNRHLYDLLLCSSMGEAPAVEVLLAAIGGGGGR